VQERLRVRRHSIRPWPSYAADVKRVLLTGMSGTGKTTVTQRLIALGYRAVDLDDGWCEPQPDGRLLWREDALNELLDEDDGRTLFVAGCEENMGTFLPRFDVVVLLTARVETMLERIAVRTNNSYGKSPDERARVLQDLHDVQPLLRRVAHHEVDTTAGVDEVVRAVLVLTGEQQAHCDGRAGAG
jgi:shikimate kinase